MEKSKASPDVDSYIAGFPPEVQEKLQKIRQVIRQAAPQAEEGIAYMMPAYKLHGPLVYFGGFAKHISLFPTSSVLHTFEEELAPYERSKGTIRFPLEEELPYDLIRRITAFRVEENQAKFSAKQAAKKKK